MDAKYYCKCLATLSNRVQKHKWKAHNSTRKVKPHTRGAACGVYCEESKERLTSS